MTSPKVSLTQRFHCNYTNNNYTNNNILLLIIIDCILDIDMGDETCTSTIGNIIVIIIINYNYISYSLGFRG